MTVLLPGAEPCPGHLEWSAFGASYADTVCSSALDWSECDHAPVGELCDADDDFRPKGTPCPFCDWAGFAEYLGFGEAKLLWASDESEVTAGTELDFHDARDLWWTATHPQRGEERILVRRAAEDDEPGPVEFVSFVSFAY